MKKNLFNKVFAFLMVTFFVTSTSFAHSVTLKLEDYQNLDDKYNLNVANLQDSLFELGYFDDQKISGKMDKYTIDSITEFQRENELKVTGKLNEETIQVLNDLIKFVNEESEKNISDIDEEGVDATGEMYGEVVDQNIFVKSYHTFINFFKNLFK